MIRMTPGEMAKTISAGLLSFPVTHFKAELSFDEHAYRRHCDWLLQHEVSGLFAVGGTGEFETRGRVPVLVRWASSRTAATTASSTSARG